MRIEGTLAKWNDAREFGFITYKRDTQNIFVHISAFPRDSQRPQLGELLSFEIDHSGKNRAVNVSRPSDTNTVRSQCNNRSKPHKNLRPVGLFVILVILFSI
jgi:cold shock CspA family protein